MKGQSLDLSQVKSIRDLVYDYIRDAILTGDIKPGDRIVETEVADKLRVSRTPVREALRRMEKEDLVEYIPRKGMVVIGLSLDDIEVIYSIRKALEALAITYTTKNATHEEITEMNRLNSEAKERAEKGDTAASLQATQKFHKALIDSCKVPRLIRLASTYQEYLDHLRAVTLSERDRQAVAFDEHEAIVKAVAQGDAERAARLVEEHIQKALHTYLSTVGSQHKV